MRIAVTGGIASGKSQVCNIVEKLGGAVIYADKINKEIIDSEEFLVIAKNELGEKFITNNAINKKLLRQAICDDETIRHKLNSLLHMSIRDEIIRQMDASTTNVFVEIPLLITSNMQSLFDRIWYVAADDNTRIARLMERDKTTLEEAQAMLAIQSMENQSMELSTDIIHNNDTYYELCKKIEELYQKIQ